ncbi:FeoB-associated Cys-rich membrane protein [Flavobacterium sp.]|nr:FeoB-associated Cys-rich membrane protein [Flavobacterium sp.]MDD3003727.1 FeoB-associated Cys-rich membrane protein [Flavobacterium sp.]
MIDFQEIIAFLILFAAVFYLVQKFFWKKKNKKSCGTDDTCGDCH